MWGSDSECGGSDSEVSGAGPRLSVHTFSKHQEVCLCLGYQSPD